jgi:signal transduction histidine kinase
MYFKTKDETSRRMNQGSHGIGLNICKKFALSLGGDLVHNDNVEKGAQFILSLTLDKSSIGIDKPPEPRSK